MNEVKVFSVIEKHSWEKNALKKLLVEALENLNYRNTYTELHLINGKLMKRMHKKVTNVLAYPAVKSFPHPETERKYLGEIYLNPSFIRRNKEDIKFMAIHGLLHLLGYSHSRNNNKIKMERKEIQLLNKLHTLVRPVRDKRV